MTNQEAISASQEQILSQAAARYGLMGYTITQIGPHDGGRNLVYACEMAGALPRILRISYLPDRTREDYLAEVEFVQYLATHGAGVADVLPSTGGNLLEEIVHGGHTFYACLFERAKGKMLVENGYQYREGAPLSEYFVGCGRTLGRMHQLAKAFVPTHRRYGFFDKFNPETIDALVPAGMPRLAARMKEILSELERLERTVETFGLIHFDYNDGNYNIDFDTGDITVYDFDNCCYCFYLYDLAGVWTHGVGWVQFEPDAAKRRAFMDGFFQSVLLGYRAETNLDPALLAHLPLFIDATVMENILDELDVMRREGEELEDDDAEMAYLIRCLECHIPYKGFFDPMYDHVTPFAYEE